MEEDGRPVPSDELVASSVADLARKIERAANALPEAYERGVFQMALETKNIFLLHAAGAGLIPGQKISGVGKSGAKWGVGFDVKGGTANPTALVKSRGPIWLVEGPVKAHHITAKGARHGTQAQRKQARAMFQVMAGGSAKGARAQALGGRGAKALTIGDGFARTVHHPGVRGKRFAQPAREHAKRVTSHAMRQHIRYSIKAAGFGR